eukprot:COSAG05_NODE_6_length_45604_cov_26.489660_29_plen_63_part_00
MGRLSSTDCDVESGIYYNTVPTIYFVQQRAACGGKWQAAASVKRTAVACMLARAQRSCTMIH